MSTDNKDVINQLVEKIKREVGLNDPRMNLMLVSIVNDTVTLGARAAAGENVDKDVLIVKATALNLADRDRQIVVTNIMTFFQNVLIGVLSRAIPLA